MSIVKSGVTLHQGGCRICTAKIEAGTQICHQCGANNFVFERLDLVRAKLKSHGHLEERFANRVDQKLRQWAGIFGLLFFGLFGLFGFVAILFLFLQSSQKSMLEEMGSLTSSISELREKELPASTQIRRHCETSRQDGSRFTEFNSREDLR